MANWPIAEVLNKVRNHTFTSENIGDTSSIDIGGTPYDIVLIGINHDDLADGSGKAYTTWQLKYLYNTQYAYNSTNTTTGGYAASDMHKTYLPSIFNQIQSDVKNAIKPVIKKGPAGADSVNSSNIVDINCNLFLLSEIEIFGEVTLSAAGEGTQYTYWSQHNTDNDRRKGMQSSPYTYRYWCERSPNIKNPSNFCMVDSSGAVGTNGARYGGGVPFAFCLDLPPLVKELKYDDTPILVEYARKLVGLKVVENEDGTVDLVINSGNNS